MEFKVGAIIRKISKTGVQYGSYLIVESANKSTVFAYYINPPNEELILLSRKSVTVCSMITLVVSHEDMVKISDNDLTCFTHKATKLWSKTADENPDLIRIKDKTSTKSIVFSNCLFQRVMKHRLVKSAEKFYERDIIENIPSIKIYFGSKILEK